MSNDHGAQKEFDVFAVARHLSRGCGCNEKKFRVLLLDMFFKQVAATLVKDVTVSKCW